MSTTNENELGQQENGSAQLTPSGAVYKIGAHYREQALKSLGIRNALRVFGISLSIAALFAQHTPFIDKGTREILEWALLLAAFIVQLSAEYVSSRMIQRHLTARDASRWFLLLSSLSDEGTQKNIPLDDLKQLALGVRKFSEPANSSEHYFHSKTDSGVLKLILNVHESVYFTQALMAIQTERKRKRMFLLVGVIALLLITALTLWQDDTLNPYLLSTAILSIAIPLIIELIHLERTQIAIAELVRLETRVHDLVTKSDIELSRTQSLVLELFAKYYSVTSMQEPIDRDLYKDHNGLLTKNYAEHIANITTKR